MELVKWSEELSVGIKELDNEHKKLIELLNQLYTGMKNREVNTVIKPILDSLVNYTLSHFAHEEKYFKKYNYPKAVEHIKEHENFKKEVSVFMEDFDARKVALSSHMLNFLSAWVTNHIKKQDKEYIKFFIEKGLE